MKRDNCDEPKVVWTINRKELEKIVIALNHATRPFMDFCFNPEQKKKIQIIMDYDPDEICVKVNYYVEDKN